VCPFTRSERCFSFFSLKVSPCCIFVVVTIFHSYPSCSRSMSTEFCLAREQVHQTGLSTSCKRYFSFATDLVHDFSSPVFIFVRSPCRPHSPVRAQTHRFLLAARATSSRSIFYFRGLAPGLSAIWVSHFLAPVGSCPRQGEVILASAKAIGLDICLT
jgi:hypothetical protein